MYLQERIKEINQKLKILEGVSNVAVWGAGLHTAKLFEKTELLSYKITSILDMGAQKQGELFFGWTIHSPREIDWTEIDAVVISAPNRESDIVDMLENQFGYRGIIVTLYNGEGGGGNSDAIL